VPARRGVWRARALGRPRGGFTLIEILLALVLIGLLAAAAAWSLGTFAGSQALGEGASRLETALRMARADAANRGRRLRLAFSEDDGRCIVLWEPDPLAEPGKFVEFTACTWADFVSLDGIRVERCELTAPSIYQMADFGAMGGGATASLFVPITFEPDGSSDSAIIEVSAADPREVRRAFIELDGLTGLVTTNLLTPEEFEALYAAP
jgi:prepilin-type N-terminal cleavage/methylation domain-containing protein